MVYGIYRNIIVSVSKGGRDYIILCYMVPLTIIPN